MDDVIISVIFIGITCVLYLLYVLINHFILKPNKTSYVLGVLLNHFKQRNEQPMEFRVTEEKAKNKNREFEVKTIHQKFYRVVIKGLKVQISEPIDGFSINEEKCYIRGRVNPTDFEQFSIAVREELGIK